MSAFFLASAFGVWLSSQVLQPAGSSVEVAPAPVPGPGQIINKHGDIEDAGNLRIADWARRWEKGNTMWHRSAPNAALVAQAPKLAKQPSAECQPSILVPLCGKSVDLVWLYQRGYKVVGIEIVTQGIIEFFTENSDTFPKFIAEKVPGTSIYRYSTPDGRLQLIQADIFSKHLSTALLLGQDSAGFDAVWDRASLVALNPHTRPRYVTALLRLLAPDAQYLVNFCEYDQTLMNGPPFSVPETQFRELFSAYTKHERVECVSGLLQDNGPKLPRVEYESKTFILSR